MKIYHTLLVLSCVHGVSAHWGVSLAGFSQDTHLIAAIVLLTSALVIKEIHDLKEDGK